MTSTVLVPALRTGSGARRPTGTRLEPVPPAPAASRRGTLRVLIANHQPIVRHGLRALLAGEPDTEVVAETDCGAEAVRLARRLRPDVVLVDLLLPTQDGISVTRTIRADVPGTQVIVMAGADEDAAAVEAIRAGAVAYLAKDTRVEALVRAVRGAATGQVALPAEVAARLMGLGGRRDVLSAREAEVLRLVARGLANKQIARELGVSLSTVKVHVGSLLAKLALSTRTQLALYAARTGLVALERYALGPADIYATTAA